MHKLWSCELTTPLGPMLAIANQQSLLLLNFLNSRHLPQQLKALEKQTGARITPGRNEVINVPCHRVIESSGGLGGYGGGTDRKKWLLDHETGSSQR